MYPPSKSSGVAPEALTRLSGFGPGALVMTDQGELPVEWLVTGDRVVTRDHGLQPVLWIGRVCVSPDRLARMPWLAPMEIAAGGLGPERPDHATVLGRHTRVLLTGWQVEIHTGTNEALAEIGGLADGERILPPTAVTDLRYTQVLLPGHAVVQVNGLWVESLLLDAGARTALNGILPASIATRPNVEAGHAQAARWCLTEWEVRAILGGRVSTAARMIDRVA